MYSQGDVVVTRNGNLMLGKIELQRKGGDGWRRRGGARVWWDRAANQLQFKIAPSEVIESSRGTLLGCEKLQPQS